MTVTEEQRERLERTSIACEEHWLLCPAIINPATFGDLGALLSALSTVSTRADEAEAKCALFESALRSIASGPHVADALAPGQRAINIARKALGV